jgi:cytochrome c peroxidase
MPLLPYYAEDWPDGLGYAANMAGRSFLDGGVGSFLVEGHPLSQPSVPDTRWVPLAPQNVVRFQVPTLRNADKRPYPEFVSLWSQWVSQKPEGDRAFLQYAR